MAKTAGTEVREVAGAIVSMRIDELISSMAIGIAEGQMRLDDACREIAQFMGSAQIEFGTRPGTTEPEKHSLIELGFTPNFYQFVDTILEVRVAVSTQYAETWETASQDVGVDEASSQSSATDNYASSSYYYGGGSSYRYGWPYGYGYGYSYGGSSSSSSGTRSSSAQRKTVSVNTVDAKYASSYNYAVEGSSVIKTKLVPIPPPSVLEELIRDRARLIKIETDNALRRDEAKKIVPLVRTALTALLATDVMKSVTQNITPNRAEAFGKAVAALETELAKLTRDHWIAMAADASGAAAATAVDTLNTNRASLTAQAAEGEGDFPDAKTSNAAAAKAIDDALTTANTNLYPPATT